LATSDAGWRIGVGGRNVTGTISLPIAADATEPWKMEFKHLKFSHRWLTCLRARKTGADSRRRGPQQAESGIAIPRRIPRSIFTRRDDLGQRQLGDVQARLEKLEDGLDSNS